MKRVAFFMLHAYPVVAPAAAGLFGGSETRAVTFAEGLARSKLCEVELFARHRELRAPRVIHDVTWRPWRDRWTEMRAEVADAIELAALPRLRIKRWNPSLLWQLPVLASTRFWRMRRDPRRSDAIFDTTDAEIFASFGINSAAVQTVYNAQRLRRTSVLFIGSDGDLDERFYPGSDYVSPYDDRAEPSYWVLRNADLIIAQTERQQQWLAERFDRTSIVLPNPFDFSAWERHRDAFPFASPWGEAPYGLWIGRAEPHHKRPQLMLELARAVPEKRFLMVLNPSDAGFAAELHAQCPANLRIIDRVPFRQMASLFQQADVFISTSAAEGFPNVFLQAIASRVPILSLAVGAEFLQESRGGICVQDQTEEAVARLQSTLTEPLTDAEARVHADRFIRARYDATAVSQQLWTHLQTAPSSGHDGFQRREPAGELGRQ